MEKKRQKRSNEKVIGVYNTTEEALEQVDTTANGMAVMLAHMNKTMDLLEKVLTIPRKKRTSSPIRKRRARRVLE